MVTANAAQCRGCECVIACERRGATVGRASELAALRVRHRRRGGLTATRTSASLWRQTMLQYRYS